MNGKRRVGLVVAAFVIASCAPADETAQEQPADTAAAMAAPAPGDADGTWDVRAVPVSGDTAATVFQIQVAAGTWTMLLPNRDPITMTVVTAGDSIIADAGPYQSVRREGQMVSTRSVMRIAGDQLTGTTTAHYQTTGADSVMQLTLTGTRVR